MAFFYIERTNELDKIGHYPQTSHSKVEGYDVEAYNSPRKMRYNSFPDFAPRYAIDLHQNSVVTDILDRASLPFGMVVSEKLKTVLTRFKLPPHRFYAIDVFGTELKYYWFHSITDIENYLNFESTVVEIFHTTKFHVIETAKFKSFEDLKTTKRETVIKRGRTMRFKHVQLNSDFPQYDLFQIDGVQYFTLISEKLRYALITENITGIEKIVAYPKIDIDIIDDNYNSWEERLIKTWESITNTLNKIQIASTNEIGLKELDDLVSLVKKKPIYILKSNYYVLINNLNDLQVLIASYDSAILI